MAEAPRDDRALWTQLAAQIAVDSIRATTAAGSGHPTSSMSCAHLLAVLAASHLRCDLEQLGAPTNDRLILSKGHAAPALYATLKALGTIDDRELLSLRRLGSRIEGHPAPVDGMPMVEVATGSLGQGLSAGLGMALAMRLEHSPARVWVVLGDSEMAEGSVWEALETAAYHGVRNLTAIIDVNRLGQRGPTMLGWDCDAFVARARAFGWRALSIDGHDVAEIDRAYREAADGSAPTLVAARTEKGHGVSFLANAEGWHGKPLSADEAERAITELGGEGSVRITPPAPVATAGTPHREPSLADSASRYLPLYQGPVATRKAFGEALAALAPHWPD
ncbi:MAG: 1-deoxy-D-xylulose-5-phosphate synthase N-terminal domain-containing protein, partial [Acidimicrobiia bacterium]